MILNRASFAITLEEFAQLTVNVNDAFNSLTQHPNIVLALEKDEDTQEDKPTFMYLGGEDTGYMN